LFEQATLSNRFQQRDLMIIQSGKRDTFRITVELIELALVDFLHLDSLQCFAARMTGLSPRKKYIATAHCWQIALNPTPSKANGGQLRKKISRREASYETPKNIRRDCRPLRLFRFLFLARCALRQE